MKRNNYLTVQAWMRAELQLKGNELLVYALIYSFSQGGSDGFSGTLSYIAEWCGATKQGVLKNLKSLADKGLITKASHVERGVTKVTYRTTEDGEGGQLSLTPVKQSLTGGSTEFNGGGKLSLTSNNIIDNNIDTKDIESIPPTLEEVKEYIHQRGDKISAEKFMDYYNKPEVRWHVGKHKMKSWKAAVNTWELNEKALQKKLYNPVAPEMSSMQGVDFDNLEW